MSLNKEQTDPYTKATQMLTKRFVVEDSITKVTSDGEPHEMMTMVAGLSGLFAAVVILVILASLVGCKRKTKHCKNGGNCAGVATQCPSGARRTSSNLEDGSIRSSSICTTYTRTASLNGGSSNASTPTLSPPAISIIYSGNLPSNLNSAFVGSELSLNGSLAKQKKKRTHWSDEVEAQAKFKETALDIEF